MKIGYFQKLFETKILDQLQPAKIFVCAINNVLREYDIELSHDQLSKIENSIRTTDSDSFTINIDDQSLDNLSTEQVEELQEKISIALKDLPEEIKTKTDNLYNKIPTIITDLSDEIANILLKNIKRTHKQSLHEHQLPYLFFEANLYEDWGEALDLLESLIFICLEVGEDFNKKYRRKAKRKNDYAFDVLVRLHARACQVAREILVLLRAGFADGAHARWRSLHEIAAVSFFIKDNGTKVAEKYLLHDAIESYKSTIDYQKYCTRLGYKPLSVKELKNIESKKDDLVKRFGKNYLHNYGWAIPEIGKVSPTFRDIEEKVSLDHLRPFYKMASHNVHANPRGIFYKLGLQSDDILLAGPSNIGLADPGHSTAISLNQITTNLLSVYSTIDTVIIQKFLLVFEREVGKAFLKGIRRIEKRGEPPKKPTRATKRQ